MKPVGAISTRRSPCLASLLFLTFLKVNKIPFVYEAQELKEGVFECAHIGHTALSGLAAYVRTETQLGSFLNFGL